MFALQRVIFGGFQLQELFPTTRQLNFPGVSCFLQVLILQHLLYGFSWASILLGSSQIKSFIVGCHTIRYVHQILLLSWFEVRGKEKGDTNLTAKTQ